MSPNIFATLELAPPDPILGLNEAYQADPRRNKVNLGVGVYLGEDGRIPLLEAVRLAEAARSAHPTARGYGPIDGAPAYIQGVERLLFGAGSDLIAQGRLTTVQALGGTGALRLGADLLKRLLPDASVLISDPSWENHRALFEAAGFPVRAYPYYNAATQGLDFPAMCTALRAAAPQTIVVLHACCHNPTGVDLGLAQWQEVIEIARARELVPYLDLAYQGLGAGLEADAAAVRACAASGMNVFIASSCSKSFSLYGERVGALSIVTPSAEAARRVLSQVKRVIRTNYSNPPIHGSALVAAVLSNSELRCRWEAELDAMRQRILAMRSALVELLQQKVQGRDFSFMLAQRGMFSYSGLTVAQVERLRVEHGIYAVSSGRICIAALNRQNVGPVAAAIAAVLHR